MASISEDSEDSDPEFTRWFQGLVKKSKEKKTLKINDSEDENLEMLSEAMESQASSNYNEVESSDDNEEENSSVNSGEESSDEGNENRKFKLCKSMTENSKF